MIIGFRKSELYPNVIWMFEFFLTLQHPQEPHIWFYSDGLSICHGLPDIKHIQVNYG